MENFPVINLENINGEERKTILDQIQHACQNWGFFEDTLNLNQIWLGSAPPSTGQACTLTLKLLFATALLVSKTNTCHTRSQVTSPKLLFSDPKYTKPFVFS
ncbi:1-aminocyclopropane-1-carboxylate oxidase 4 [Glycine soja]